MRKFIKQSCLTYRGLFGWLNWQGYLSNVVLRPVVLILLYFLLGRFAVGIGAAQSYAIGIAALGMMFIAMNGIAQSYFYDRQSAGLNYLFITPGGRLSNYLSRGILHLPNAVLAFIVGITASWLLTGINFAWLNWGVLTLTIVIIAISVTAFGQFVGVLVLITNDWIRIAGFTYPFMMALTGVIIPIHIFPGPLYEFARLLPLTSGILALRFIFDGADFYQIGDILLRELLTGMVYLTLGYAGFIYFEQRTKRTGELN